MTNHTTNSLLSSLLLFFLFFPCFHRVYRLFLLSFSFFFFPLISYLFRFFFRFSFYNACSLRATFFLFFHEFPLFFHGSLSAYIVSFLRVLGRINVRTFVHERVRYIRGSSTNNETKDSSIYKSCRVFPGGL